MRRFPQLQVPLVLLVLGSSACQRRQVAVPVAPAPRASQPPAPATAATSNPSSASPNPTPEAPEPGKYQVNKPAQAAKKAARPLTSPAPAAAPSPSNATADPAPATAAPKLGDILTADERKQYSASIDQSLSRAQESLNSIGGRQLSKDKQAEVEQIRNFMEQARSTRTSDAAGAKSLAERAEVLAHDLAASFH